MVGGSADRRMVGGWSADGRRTHNTQHTTHTTHNQAQLGALACEEHQCIVTMAVPWLSNSSLVIIKITNLRGGG